MKKNVKKKVNNDQKQYSTYSTYSTYSISVRHEQSATEEIYGKITAYGGIIKSCKFDKTSQYTTVVFLALAHQVKQIVSQVKALTKVTDVREE